MAKPRRSPYAFVALAEEPYHGFAITNAHPGRRSHHRPRRHRGALRYPRLSGPWPVLGRPDGRGMVLQRKPEFAILDLEMPKLTGSKPSASSAPPESVPKLMVLSITRDESTVKQALRAGADAYLLKDGPSRHLLDAITFVREGGVYVSPLLRGAALFTKPENIAAPEDPLAALSPRELEVFAHLVNGLRAKDIAQLLEYQPKNRGHLSGWPDAQTKRPRLGRAGKVRHRTQSYEHFPSTLNRMRGAGSARLC